MLIRTKTLIPHITAIKSVKTHLGYLFCIFFCVVKGPAANATDAPQP